MKKLLKKKNLKFADQDFSTQLLPTGTAQESIWQFNRANGFTLCEGIFHRYLDMHGGYYDHPRIISAVGQMAAMLDRSKTYDRSSVAQVLVVADEFSLCYGAFQMDDPNNPYTNRINHGLLAFQDGFIRSGAPFDTVLMQDLPQVQLDPYKFVVFLNTYQVDDAMRQFIDQHVKCDNRTIMFCYAPGLFNGHRASAENMYQLTGIKIVPSEDETFINPKFQWNTAGGSFMQNHGEKPFTAPIHMDIKAAATLRKVGEKEPESKNPEGRICKLFFVQDPASQGLGEFPATGNVVMAIKKMPHFTSIYTLIPALPADLVRAIEKSAGVHIYSNGNDAFYANRSYLVVHAASAGTKTITLPAAVDIYDAMTEASWYHHIQSFDVSLMAGETQILRYHQAQSGTEKP